MKQNKIVLKKILVVFGTRPEAIKMAPLILKLKEEKQFQIKVCVTAQHREMLDQVLEIFEIKPDFDLNVMTDSQSLESLFSTILINISKVYEKFNPDLILVHGDTSTTFASSLAAYYKKIPIGHVEAGLRTNDLFSPWPEEANRKLTASLANLHFSPTIAAKKNLINEGIDNEKIYVTGNTVIDSLLIAKNLLNSNEKLKNDIDLKIPRFNKDNKMILVTGHRRENFGEGFKQICEAIKEIALNNKNVEVVYPVHLNPNVKKPVFNILSSIPNIHLIDPVEYLTFIRLMNKSYLILTDSGGIQEEAPSIGKPVIVMRSNTERPEAVDAGTVILAGSNKDKIVSSVESLLIDKEKYLKMSKSRNPYGDGNASKNIVEILKTF